MKRLYSLLTFLVFITSYQVKSQYKATVEFGSYNTKMISPGFLTIDTSGNIFVTDFTTQNIQIFDKNWNYIKQLGGLGTDSTHLNHPYGIAVNNAGDVYVADGSNNRINVFKKNGKHTPFGSKGQGNGQFNFPYAIAINKSSDTVFVADYSNDRIQAFNATGTFLFTFGEFGDSISQFSNPNGIAVSTTKDLYIADNGNNRVQIFTSKGIFKSVFSGTGIGKITNISGITLDKSDNVYLVDNIKSIINKYDKTGHFITQYGGSSQLSSPYGICIDSAGKILVADKGKSLIQIFDSAGIFKSQFGNGSRNNQLYYPNGIAVTKSSVYIVDKGNNRILKFDKNGNPISSISNYGPSDNISFNNPTNIFIDKNENIYITDSGNNSVVILDKDHNFKGSFGSAGTGNGQFSNPYGVAFSSTNDTIYVTDFGNNRVQLFTVSGTSSITATYINKFGTIGSDINQFYGPRGIAISKSSNIFVADGSNHRIQVFDRNGKYLIDFGVYGTTDTNSFITPQSVAFDNKDNLYIVDAGNNRIRIYNSSFKFLNNINQFSYDSAYNLVNNIQRSAPFEKSFNYPVFVAVDDSDNVYANVDAFRVQKFKLFGDITITGITDFSEKDDAISIYPNPNNGDFNIKVLRDLTGGDNNYMIINSIGQTIKTGSITSSFQNISGLGKGLYLISINLNKRRIVKRVLVE